MGGVATELELARLRELARLSLSDTVFKVDLKVGWHTLRLAVAHHVVSRLVCMVRVWLQVDCHTSCNVMLCVVSHIVCIVFVVAVD